MTTGEKVVLAVLMVVGLVFGAFVGAPSGGAGGAAFCGVVGALATPWVARKFLFK